MRTDNVKELCQTTEGTSYRGQVVRVLGESRLNTASSKLFLPADLLWQSKLLLLAGDRTSSSIQAFFFKGTSIVRIPKFALDAHGPQADTRMVIRQNYVTICRLYDKVYCIHFHHIKGQLHLYQMNRDSVSLSSVIDLAVEGEIVLQVVDNLLLCHCKNKQCTLIFDIREANPLLTQEVLSSPEAPEDNICKLTSSSLTESL